MMTTEYDCPTCLHLKVPIRNTMSLGKIHYADSRYYLTCEECNLTLESNDWRLALSLAVYDARKEEE